MKIIWQGYGSNNKWYRFISDSSTLNLGHIVMEDDEKYFVLFSTGYIQLREQVNEKSEMLIYLELTEEQMRRASCNLREFGDNLLRELKESVSR